MFARRGELRLPIAMAVLAASGLVGRRDVDDVLLIGALSLDGAIQPTRGILPVAAAARRCGYRGLFLPIENQCEAAAVHGLDLVRRPQPAGCGQRAQRSRPVPSPRASGWRGPRRENSAEPDFADVHGQLLARRALEIAAAEGITRSSWARPAPEKR